MTDPVTVGADPGYGIDAHLSANPDTGEIDVSTLTLGDGGGQPYSITVTPQTPIGEALDLLMQGGTPQS